MNIITGANLVLKKLEVQDISTEVMSWFSDQELMKYYTDSSKKITRKLLLQSIESGIEEDNQFTYGIFEKVTNKLIGTIKLGPINKVHKTADLVVLIGDRNYLGKGLSVEAITLGNTLAFSFFDLRKLYGGMYISNVPSIKAYTRAGWIIEGRLKGFYYLNGKNEDKILVACFNPVYFTPEEIEGVRQNAQLYYE